MKGGRSLQGWARTAGLGFTGSKCGSCTIQVPCAITIEIVLAAIEQKLWTADTGKLKHQVGPGLLDARASQVVNVVPTLYRCRVPSQ